MSRVAALTSPMLKIDDSVAITMLRQSSGGQKFAWPTMQKTTTPRMAFAAGIARVLQRLQYPTDVILLCVRWYAAYSLSLQNLEGMMVE
jgi:hypothetical protein